MLSLLTTYNSGLTNSSHFVGNLVPNFSLKNIVKSQVKGPTPGEKSTGALILSGFNKFSSSPKSLKPILFSLSIYKSSDASAELPEDIKYLQFGLFMEFLISSKKLEGRTIIPFLELLTV